MLLPLALYAPELALVDILIKVSVYDEDWYVQAPANAALKAMVRTMPAVLHIFLTRLRSSNPDEAAHSVHAIAEIADKEPGLLDPPELRREFSRLKGIGHKDASNYIAKALPKVRKARRVFGYKYSI